MIVIVVQMKSQELTSYLRGQIPLANAMQVNVAGYDGTTLHLAAPLTPNLNHHETAFGGSIATLAILGGWSLLHLALTESEVAARLMIQKITLDYLRPIDGDFEAIAAKTSDVTDFVASVQRKRKGRCTLQVEIHCNGRCCAKLEGHYVALAE